MNLLKKKKIKALERTKLSFKLLVMASVGTSQAEIKVS
jgi:hypothetical protein